MLPEYDFSDAKPNPYAKRLKQQQGGGVLVLLEPDVAKVFKSSAKVNKLLRATMEAVKKS